MPLSFLGHIFRFLTRWESASVKLTSSVAGRQHSALDRVQCFISWNEIIDSNSRIAGYLLRPRSLSADEEIDGAALSSAFANEGAARIAERRLIVMPVTPSQWHAGDIASLVAPESHVLFTGTEALSTFELLALMGKAQLLGAKIAADIALFNRDPQVAQAVSVLIIDVRGFSLQLLEQMAHIIRHDHPGIRIIADGVQSWSEHRLYLSLGFAGCMGAFVSARDDWETDDRLGQNRLVIIEMLNELRSDAEIPELSALAKRDPAIVVKLLEMANSSHSGLSRQVANLDEAMIVLGRDALYRWLALAMFRIDGKAGRDETLLILALCRATFLESLVREVDPKMADELYLVGLFSVLDSLLAMPMNEILEKVRLPAAVVAVLLRSDGPYAKHFLLMMSMERCRLNHATQLGSALGLDISDIVWRYGDAMKLATTELAA